MPYTPVRAIPEFMKCLEMPESPAAPQPPGLSVELREYQLQTLHRMLGLEAAPGGLRASLWRPVPSLANPPVWFSPTYRLLLPEAKVPPLPKVRRNPLCPKSCTPRTTPLTYEPYRPQTLNPKSLALHHKPSALNPKPLARHSKPLIMNSTP